MLDLEHPGPVTIPGALDFPPEAEFRWFTRGRFRLRIAITPVPDGGRGFVLISPGRSEFIEKYVEVVLDLKSRGFGSIILDQRGQGLSDRFMSDRLPGHATNFFHYADDLKALAEEFIPDGTPWVLLGHSMGGAIATLGLLTGKLSPAACVLSSPMMGLARLRGSFGLRSFVRLMNWLGRGKSWIPGAEREGFPEAFEVNPLTSDKGRYLRWRGLIDTSPELRLAGPTLGWVYASLKATQYIQKHAAKLSTPTLIVAAGNDPLVDSEAQHTFAENSGAKLVHVDEALHEILMERDELRAIFWKEFDGFMDEVGV